jgi:hypothetical protein
MLRIDDDKRLYAMYPPGPSHLGTTSDAKLVLQSTGRNQRFNGIEKI